MDNPRTQARSRVGVAAKRHHRVTTQESWQALEDARRDYAAETLAEYVAQIVATFPPLTNEQLDRIAVLLRPPPLDASPTP